MKIETLEKIQTKKELVEVIRVPFIVDTSITEKLLLNRYAHIVKNEHAFREFDLNIFCAIIVRHFPEDHNTYRALKDYMFPNGIINDDVKFKMIMLQKELEEPITDEDNQFYRTHNLQKVKRRKEIVMHEINRTGVNNPERTVFYNNSQDLRNLINNINKFPEGITFIDWYVPISLTFERLVHIYIRHVEDTKFNVREGVRTFFDYKIEDIWTLIKLILKREEESIKDHFLEVNLGVIIKHDSYIKPYFRGIKNKEPIYYNGDEFCLEISKQGFIQTFYPRKKNGLEPNMSKGMAVSNHTTINNSMIEL